jgi:hypothetical protein
VSNYLVYGVRIAAFVVSAIMLHYFLTRDVFRADNPFLVPDLTFSILIFLSALLPQRIAIPALMFSFSLAAGVISVSFFTSIVRGQFDMANLALLVGLVTASAFLGYGITTLIGNK